MNEPIQPTKEQAMTCLRLCVNVTRFYLSIHIIRLDERSGELYLLAGEDIGIVIQRDGIWRYD
jgi:hypothetical protein